ncbi:MAG TPA: acylglycerol kinase family protein, partial [Abditibacterium sp.]
MPALFAVLNPKSGSSGDEYRAQIETALHSRGLDFEIRETDPEHGAVPAVQQALQDGATQILACGGDGTIMSAVNALARLEPTPKTLFSIVPGGTANLLAQALSIPQDVEKAIEIAVAGHERLIDLGECGEHVFAL